MILARVIAVVVSTVKHRSLDGYRLLLVQPLMSDRRTGDGEPVVAVDATGAGAGQRVMLTSDGQAARQLLHSDATPVRWTIIGIEDHT
jgi:ethanolamine utilization protein EutN